jgi:G patch domain-containing protein 1
MATRFTSSTTAPKIASDAPDFKDTLLSKPAPKPEDPAEQAARLGMYGPLTRSSSDWYPTRLLCKRFNVKPPANVQPGATDHEERDPPPKNMAGDLVGKERMRDILLQSGGANPLLNQDRRDSELPMVIKEEVKEVIVEPDRNEALEGQKAGEAVFKAIFGDDSDDD